MKLVIACGVALLCLAVFLAGTILPDTTEATLLSVLANAAEDSKRSAVMNSIEMQAALVEIEGLELELEQAKAEIKAQEQMCGLVENGGSFVARMKAAWPW